MNDLFSKATFGFLMAQFMPGVIAVFSLVIIYFTATDSAPNSLLGTASAVMALFGGPAVHQLTLIGLCTGAGMTIHGLHWSVLGFLENHFADTSKTPPEPRALSKTFGHDWRIWSQVLMGPLKLIAEIFLFFLKGEGIEEAAIQENVPRVPRDQFQAFQFIQDFYLHFSQFYAHTSYALVALCGAVSAFSLSNGFTIRRVVVLGALYLLSGLFFLMGRIQLAALFVAENAMCQAQVLPNPALEPAAPIRS